MKIIILIRILWYGGALKIAIEEAKELRKRGHNVKLIILRGKTTKEIKDLLNGIDWEIMHDDKPSFLTPIYSYVTKKFRPDRGKESTVDLNLIKKFRKKYAIFNPEYIICHDQWSGLAGYYYKRWYKTKYSVVVHEAIPDYTLPILSIIAKHYEKLALLNATKVLSVTPRVQESILSKYKINSTLLGYSVSAKKFLEYPEKKEQIIAVSMWDLGRKPEVYLQLISRLKNFKLLMIGAWRDDTTLNSFLNKLNELKLKDSVEIIQNVTEEKLYSLYGLSKFNIRFSFEEVGGGMSVFEALSCGTPSIVNERLGSSEFIRDYKIGFVISNDNELLVDETIACIKKEDNPISFKSLQESMRKALHGLGWDKHVDLLIPPFEEEWNGN